MKRAAAIPLLALLAVIGIGLLLDGCSTAVPTVVRTTAASTPTADLRPWASTMSAQATQLDQVKSKLTSTGCDAAAANTMPCGAQFVAATIQAQTLALQVDSLTNPKATSYISRVPPHEVANIYFDVKNAADQASTDGAAWSNKCIGSNSSSCLTDGVAFTSDLDNLTTAFGAWEPYE